MSADNSRVFAAQHGVAEFLAALEVQRRDYRRSLPARFDALEAAWLALSGGNATSARLGELERQAHNLAGTAGTFGLRELSAKARSLEILVKGHSALSGSAHQITEAIASLRSAVPEAA